MWCDRSVATSCLRAYRFVPVDRLYEAQRLAADAHLSGRITELAPERRRSGYRRIWQLLRREDLPVLKRVYRIYHLNGLSVKRRRRHKGLAAVRLPLLRPDAPDLTRPMNFVMDAQANGRRNKCLTCVKTSRRSV